MYETFYKTIYFLTLIYVVKPTQW